MCNSRLIKMRGIKIMAMMALLIIAVSGCKSSGSASIADIDVRKGTEGLSMEFLKGSPPDKVFEDAPFSVFFGIHNKGAFEFLKNLLDLGELDVLLPEDSRVFISEIGTQ